MSRAQTASKITVVGHRGARGIYPENTMSGFRYLRDIGAEAVEFDVQNAAGRVPVVAHDPYIAPALTRDRNGEWISGEPRLILKTAITELAELDVGALRPGTDYAARFPDQARLSGERIPTLAALCEWAVTEPSLLLNIEVKSHALKTGISDPPDVLVNDVIGVLEANSLTQRTVVSSFDWRVMESCARRAPEVARGYLTLLHSHGTAMEPNIIDGSAWMDGARRADHQGSLTQTIADLGGQVWCPRVID